MHEVACTGMLGWRCRHLYTFSLVVEGKKHPNPEKNGRELNLVSIDAEFPIGRHIQNPLNSSIRKKNYNIF